MERPFLLSDSLMCMDPLRVGEQLAVLDKYMDCHHADVMDGHFCPNLMLGTDFIKAVCCAARKPVDVHLMTERPQDWIEVFANAGAAMISIHAETIQRGAFRLFREIRERGCKVGLVLNPFTPFDAAQCVIDEIDRLTVMTVDPGYAGQPLIPQTVKKIRQAADFKRRTGARFEIQIDGCCNKNTYALYRGAGAEMLVMGSGLFGLSEDLETAVSMALEQQQEAIIDEK